ncbi:hypothetical protein BJF79_31985 [Actinomadura sp. CNU-125]|uniref:TetR/AcrR family transcriptional regulator n=1 Tax=Actinomadura sp. CNU-125 TaxID=1904961 RepID=UPI000969AECA|nr:TetR/AcrR family transcriptional regulator [Actinomadura sp. CNU-125]OLT35738.1 hypothetical protein BJF79_31985 [Actinomadura sp. CNU-125]
MPAARPAHQPRKTPRQQRAWRTRGRVLAAAAQVFAEYGYASATTDRVAARAGVSIGSLYQYFPNKDAILLALTEEHLERAARTVRETLAEPRPLDRWVPDLVRTVVGAHAADPRLHQVLLDQAPRPPELVERFHRAEAEAVLAVRNLLDAEPGLDLADPACTARFVVAIVESLTHRLIGRPQVDLEELTAEIVAIVTAYATSRRQN